ncbi:MAG: hypothetical protein KIS66_17335 [Fimbriimonadaceae bacterium]|nr:hypothetical protein [Fimbriimonadaceae bacterium]
MNVPPVFPEQIVIPGNVAEERYAVRLWFLRWVVALHFGTVAVLFVVAWAKPFALSVPSAALGLLGALLALSAVRQWHRERPEWDARLSWVLLPVVVVLAGTVLGGLPSVGWPYEGVAGAVLGWVAYTCLCGRDFSFMGLGFVAGIGALAGAIGGVFFERYTAADAGRAACLGLGFAFFFVYDLAALLTRRRRQDAFAAVADLYRDVLNALTYSGRVYRHWKKYPFRVL